MVFHKNLWKKNFFQKNTAIFLYDKFNISEQIENFFCKAENMICMQVINSTNKILLKILVFVCALIAEGIGAHKEFSFFLIGLFYLLILWQLLFGLMKFVSNLIYYSYNNTYFISFRDGFFIELHISKGFKKAILGGITAIIELIIYENINNLGVTKKPTYINNKKYVAEKASQMCKLTKHELAVLIYDKIIDTFKNSLVIVISTTSHITLYYLGFLLLRTVVFNNIYSVNGLSLIFEPIKIILH